MCLDSHRFPAGRKGAIAAARTDLQLQASLGTKLKLSQASEVITLHEHMHFEPFFNHMKRDGNICLSFGLRF